MFNLGAGEITVILVLALIFLGPKKLPDLASGLGKLIREIRKATADVKNEITLDDSFRKPFEELRDAVTLHPDELKRRDQIKRQIEEAKKRAEEAEALMAATAALPAVADLPELPAVEAPATITAMAEPVQIPEIMPPVSPPSGTVARARPAPAVVDVHETKDGTKHDTKETIKDAAPMSVASPDESAPFPPPSLPTPNAEVLTTPAPAVSGAPGVTPPVSGLDGARANVTQTLSETDLLASMPQSKRKPTPPPLPGLDRQPPAANRMGLPRVTPPVSSLSGDRANATQSLSESDLLPPDAGNPPPPPGPKKT